MAWEATLTVLVIVSLLAGLMGSTKGRLNQAQWFVLCVGTALVAGILFWSLTESTGELTFEKAGIKLGGGAAIGGAFMLLAWQLASSQRIQRFTQSFVIVNLPEKAITSTTYIPDHSPDILIYPLPDGKRVLVEFREGINEGWFVTEHLSKDAKEWVPIRHPVRRL